MFFVYPWRFWPCFQLPRPCQLPPAWLRLRPRLSLATVPWTGKAQQPGFSKPDRAEVHCPGTHLMLVAMSEGRVPTAFSVPYPVLPEV